jgi:hypothetical protein
MQMPTSHQSRPSELAGLESRSVTARVLRAPNGVATRIGDAAWLAFHALGAHRWRDGWETNDERGWSRYRGSRCTICDEPWEGW